MRSPAMMKSLVAEGAETMTGTPAELAARIRAGYEPWRRVVKAAINSGK